MAFAWPSRLRGVCPPVVLRGVCDLRCTSPPAGWTTVSPGTPYVHSGHLGSSTRWSIPPASPRPTLRGLRPPTLSRGATAGQAVRKPELDKLLSEPECVRLLAEPELDKLLAEPELDRLLSEPELDKLLSEPELVGLLASQCWTSCSQSVSCTVDTGDAGLKPDVVNSACKVCGVANRAPCRSPRRAPCRGPVPCRRPCRAFCRGPGRRLAEALAEVHRMPEAHSRLRAMPGCSRNPACEVCGGATPLRTPRRVTTARAMRVST